MKKFSQSTKKSYISIRAHVLTLKSLFIGSVFCPCFSILFTIKIIIYLENVRSLIYSFVVLLHSNGQASVSFTLKFGEIFWWSVLDLHLAMENGTLLGFLGVMDEASCKSGSHNCKLTSHVRYILFSCLVLNEF